MRLNLTESVFEEAVLTWFDELGYVVRNGLEIAPDEPGAERVLYSQVILTERLRSQIVALNHSIPANAIEAAIQQLQHPNLPSLVQANRQFHRWLRDGVRVEFQRDGETVADFVRLFDLDRTENNDWLAVNQFSVKGAHHTRRPDIIIFINGLPVAVLELKNPADENADIWDAFNQLQTYKEHIPDLFTTNEFLVIADSVTARVGSLTADKERFMAWRTIDGQAIDPLGRFRETETLIRGLFRRDLLLEYLRDFILFEDSGEIVKKIAAYHQFHAVRKAVETTLHAVEPSGDKKAGVVWHTQGSGKSISMCFYAGKVMTAPEMKNPTLVVVTDRNDLDGQLYAQFSMAKEILREEPRPAETRKQLRELLGRRPSGGIIFTTIQKFSPFEEEDTFPILSERDNIVVICDEAHRTQYGLMAKINAQTGELQYGYAKHMRDALPNASFIAFTGTPVSFKDRDTRAIFGDYLDIYDMEQAQADGATVPIYYESRLAKLELREEETPRIDEDVEELTEDEEDAVKARIKTRWAALEKLVGAEPRLKQVAADFLQHFDKRLEAMEGKAMFVCMSREICAHLYNEIVALRPEWHDPDPKKGAIKIVMTGSSSDKELLRPHLYSKQTKKELEKRFKDPQDEFKVVIVRDMWLTGFDVPPLHTMYVDKPMRGHTLMQAIARVNRVFKDKPGGLVVDYIGIGHELKQALSEYTESGAHGRPALEAEEAVPILVEKVKVARGMLHGFDYQDFETDAYELLPGAADHILGLGKDSRGRDGKQRFSDCVTAMTKAFALCCTLDDALVYREEVAFYQAVKAVLTKHETAATKISDEQREHALRQLVSRAVMSNEVIDIFQAVGLKKPNIGILSEEFLNEVRMMPQRNLAVELLERLLKDEIAARFGTNVVQNKKFSELLQATLNKYSNRAIETAQVIEELIAMAKDFNEAARSGEKLGLSNEEVAFYDALETSESAVRDLGDEVLRKIAIELTERLRKNVSVDWSVRETVRARLRLLVKRILRKYKYPPEYEPTAVETVLKQAETLSTVWVS
ncbi:MAG TPA: type I restriction endonuclease subunit R [Pyrinomonadaceae bacterium]|nr:type I restriction endonuclease subunit R [Pyrinomonadaceae bacterium]